MQHESQKGIVAIKKVLTSEYLEKFKGTTIFIQKFICRGEQLMKIENVVLIKINKSYREGKHRWIAVFTASYGPCRRNY